MIRTQEQTVDSSSASSSMEGQLLCYGAMLITLLILLLVAAHADARTTSAQAANLGTIQADIQLLIEKVRRAQDRDTGGRSGQLEFNYRALIDDLILIERGIDDFQKGRRQRPEQIPPINARYR